MQNQAGYHRQAFFDIRCTGLPVGSDTPYTLFGENINTRAQQVNRLQQVVSDHRDGNVELEITGLATEGDGGVVAHHLGGDLQDNLGNHRIDLSWHDR